MGIGRDITYNVPNLIAGCRRSMKIGPQIVSFCLLSLSNFCNNHCVRQNRASGSLVSSCGAFLIGKDMADMLLGILKEPREVPKVSCSIITAIKSYKKI